MCTGLKGRDFFKGGNETLPDSKLEQLKTSSTADDGLRLDTNTVSSPFLEKESVEQVYAFERKETAMVDAAEKEDMMNCCQGCLEKQKGNLQIKAIERMTKRC